MTKVTPLALANTFITKYGQSEGIQHMKLQKLAYYAHGWWLAYNTEPFLTERPQVWRYGPVFKSLYKAFAPYGKNPIKVPQKSNPFEEEYPLIPDDNPDLHNLIDWVWNRYSSYTAIQLSNMTHALGTPWLEIAKEHHFRIERDFEIPDEKIRAYFEREKKAINA